MTDTFRTIIVDDEPAARRLLRFMLNDFSQTIQIVGEASNGNEAIELINRFNPDLVFLDIQMPDLNGFEVLEQVTHQPNIIFTTAYEEFAIKAFQAFSIDYLLKPISEERLKQAIEKLKQFRKGMGTDLIRIKKIVESLQAPKPATAFPIRQGEKIMLIRFENISYFESDDKYVGLFTLEGQRLLTDHTLTTLNQILPPEFLRVQKSYIINKEKIKEIYKHFNGRFVIVMNDNKQTRITTGLTYYETIKLSLGI